MRDGAARAPRTDVSVDSANVARLQMTPNTEHRVSRKRFDNPRRQQPLIELPRRLHQRACRHRSAAKMVARAACEHLVAEKAEAVTARKHVVSRVAIGCSRKRCSRHGPTAVD